MPVKDFKIGDIVRVKNKEDLAYAYNHFYRVVEKNTTSYTLYSFQTKRKVSTDVLENFRDSDMYATNRIMFNCIYRIATKAELSLYLLEGEVSNAKL